MLSKHGSRNTNPTQVNLKAKALVDDMAEMPTGLREVQAETICGRLGELTAMTPLDLLASSQTEIELETLN